MRSTNFYIHYYFFKNSKENEAIAFYHQESTTFMLRYYSLCLKLNKCYILNIIITKSSFLIVGYFSFFNYSPATILKIIFSDIL